ncbi:MAG: hypothetical protein LDL15_03840 [Yonghaparkia sp.]|nr:hypothetical protein [Microcella sp.]
MLETHAAPTTTRRRSLRRTAAALLTSIAVAASSLVGLATVANATETYTLAGTLSIYDSGLGAERDVTASDAIGLEVYLVDEVEGTAEFFTSTLVGDVNPSTGDNWTIELQDGYYLLSFGANGLQPVWLGLNSWQTLQEALDFGDWFAPSELTPEALTDFNATIYEVDPGDGGGDPGSGYTLSGTVSIQPDADDAGSLRAAAANEVVVTAYQREWNAEFFYWENIVRGDTATIDASTGQPNWSISGLPAGTYRLAFAYNGSELNIANAASGGRYSVSDEPVNLDDLDNEVPLEVGEGLDPGSVDITLTQGAIISGTVRKTGTTTNLSGQTVTVYRQTRDMFFGLYFGEIATATTAANGSFVVDSLPPGKYAVQIGGTNGYVQEFYNDLISVGSPEEAYDEDPIDLAPGDAESLGVVGLDVGSTITGSVKNTSGSGLRNVEVAIYRNGQYGWEQFDSVMTSSTGTYTIRGLARGSYVLGYTPPTTGTTIYLPEYYNNKIDLGEATSLSIGAGVTRSGVNVVLDRAASIAGTVSFPAGATDSPNPQDASVRACLRDAEYDYVNCWLAEPASVSSTGAYRITGLRAGSYTVQVSYNGAENYRDEYFSNSETEEGASFFTVSTGAAVTGRNVQLDPGAVVQGTVRGPDNQPLEDIRVSLLPVNNGFVDDDSPTSAVTDENGQYRVVGLNSGTYVGFAEPLDGVSPVSYPRRYIGGEYSSDLATVLTLQTPTTVSGQDVQFENGASLSGQITAESSELGLANIPVEIHRFVRETGVSSDVITTTYTDGSGNYSATNLPPGSYTVTAGSDWGTSPDEFYLDEWFGGTTRKSLATRLTLASGDSDTADVALNLAGRITGRVVDSDGTPIRDISAYGGEASSMTTASDGVFTVGGFEAGPTRVNLYSESDESPFVGRDVDGPAVTTDAEPVNVGDIVLQRESFIQGRVIGRTGAVAPDTVVRAYRIGDDPWQFASQASLDVTNASGEFTLDDLPTGTYVLLFDAPGHPEQYLGGARDAALSETVVIVSEGETRSVEARLYAGPTLQGVVRNSVTGAGISGVFVNTFWEGEESYGFREARTNSTGAYVLPGLEGGSHFVTFNERSSRVGSGFQEKVETILLPTSGSVTRNASLLPTTRVSGRVTSAGVGVNGASVVARPVIGGIVRDDLYTEDGMNVVLTDASGNYTLRLDRGSYVIQVIDDAQRYPTTYLGGGDNPATATRVTVGSSTITGRNIALPTTTGEIRATVADSALTGCVELTRVIGGEPAWTTSPGSSLAGDTCLAFGSKLTDLFPIENLTPGTYNVRISAADFSDEQALLYDGLTFNDLTVTAGGVVELDGDPETAGIQPLDFGEPLPETDYTFPELVPGQEPTLTAADGWKVGSIVTVNPGQWVNPVGEVLYEWLRDGRRISGATGGSYTLRPGDAGAGISVRVLASPEGIDWYLEPVHLTDSSPAVEQGDAPVPSIAPTVTGNLRVGQTLTAVPGTWSVDRLTYAYEWIRSTTTGEPVVVSRASTYKPTTADVSSGASSPQLTLRITTTRVGFASATADVTVGTIVPAVAMKQTTKSTVTAVTGGYRVTAGAWSPSGATYSFAWRLYAADGTYTEYPGTTGTASSSTLTDPAVIGTPGRLVATVTATRSGYTPTTVVVPVRSGPRVTIDQAPVITGTPKVGFVLSLDTSGMVTTPTTTTLSYQWLRNGAAISGATKSTYSPTTSDVGRTITVRITAAATGYPSSLATPVVTGVVIVPVEPFVQGTTVIEGTPSVGRTLRVVASGWEPTPTSYSYQWRRNGSAISGATASSYRLTSSDLGREITVSVTARRTGYVSVVVDPRPSAGIITALGPQSISGVSAGASARVGTALTASVGTWDVAPSSYTYQWTRNGEPIAGATAKTYTPLVSDLGEEIAVTVVARKTGYPNSDEVSSPSLTVGLGAAVTATANPRIGVGTSTTATTTVRADQTLRATAGTWPVVGMVVRYQWQIDRVDGNGWVDLEGQDDRDLTVDVDTIDGLTAGLKLRVVVRVERAGYVDAAPIMSASVTVQ